MFYSVLLFLLCAGIIYLACEYFVNGVEWVGRRFSLGATTTGTVLAAFGTALPESAVTFVAVIFGHDEAQKNIGVGAAVGGPLVLSTISYAVVGVVLVLSRRALNRSDGGLQVDAARLSRDQGWFLLIFLISIGLGLIDFSLKRWFGVALFAAYGLYVWREMRNDGQSQEAKDVLEPLKLRPRDPDPGLGWAAVQTLSALGVMAIASRIFVSQLETIGTGLGISSQFVALLLSPVATELPETLNAVIWVRQGRERLALANISGAMMIQATVPAGLGVLFTTWHFDAPLIAAGFITVVAVVVLWALFRRRAVSAKSLIPIGALYLVFAAAVLMLTFAAGVSHSAERSVRMVQASIPMPDGVMLAATLYMPAKLRHGEHVPALLEYLPYRKDDDTAPDDYGKHAYFAQHGYVGVRVDIRGFGNSGGTPPTREYSAQEQEDGERVIAWLARQPWSNGKVGMFGISWGGFNSIQMAMRRPPALKAILAVAATEALFKEDVHYMDGVMHVDEFEVAMDLDQGRSGAPAFALDEDTLAKRMDSTPWSLDYFKHQRDGAFWKAPIGRFEDIRIPCFLIGGLQDGYRDSIPRMLERVPAPVHAWIGPWNHDFPNSSMYGPRFEWRDQAVRWFDHWLKGIDNGVEREPTLVVYEQHSHPPGNAEQNVPGEWRAESWPPAGLKRETWFLAPNHQLLRQPAAAATDQLRYVPSSGTEAGFWWGELLPDQRTVDAHSLVYDSNVLDSTVSILGIAHMRLLATADAPVADWVVRLQDVAPDGQVTAITGAALAGAQRNSMEHPEALEPGKEYVLEFDLHLTSWVWESGHRIRVALSNSQWPMLWPTPYAMTTALRLGGERGSAIELPVVPLHGREAAPFAAPEASETPPGITTPGDYAWPGTWKVEHDIAQQRSTVTWHGTSAYQFPWGSVDHSEQIVYQTDDAQPAVSSALGEAETVERLNDRILTYRGHLALTSDGSNFHYAFTRELLRDGVVLRSKTWTEIIPRDLQ